MPCNIVNKNYQQDLRVLYTFVPNKSYKNTKYFLILDILPKKLYISTNF